MTLDNDMTAAVGRYLEAIKADYAAFGDASEIRRQMVEEFNSAICYETKNKFVKVITGPQRSVHSFIMLADGGKFKRGDILKPASWNGPAKNFARGNVLTDQYQVRWMGV